MWILFCILIAICIIILSSARYGVHPFLSLLLSSFVFGIMAAIPILDIVRLISEGFGETMGKIGLIIIFGVVIGTFMERTGAAQVLANHVIKLFGVTRSHGALASIGYVVSIPVFADSGFVILSSINKVLSKKTGLSLAGTSVALSMGLLASHAMVPPTPGPIAAASLLDADLGQVILIGLLSSAIGLIGVIFFAKYIGHKVKIDSEALTQQNDSEILKPPGTIKAFLPIVVPIFLIVGRSMIDYPSFPVQWKESLSILSIAGHPVIALMIGMAFAFWLPQRWNRSMLSTTGWVGESLTSAGVILMITGAGGAFGKVLQHADIAASVSGWDTALAMGLWMPFILSAILKTAQGSSTVALITTASIVMPLLPSMGLEEPIEKAMVVVAIGAGSTVVSHANDSFFWVVAQLSQMNVQQAYKTQTLGSLILGLGSMIGLTMFYYLIY